MQEYIFSFRYGEDGSVAMNVQAAARAGPAKGKKGNFASVSTYPTYCVSDACTPSPIEASYHRMAKMLKWVHLKFIDTAQHTSASHCMLRCSEGHAFNAQCTSVFYASLSIHNAVRACGQAWSQVNNAGRVRSMQCCELCANSYHEP